MTLAEPQLKRWSRQEFYLMGEMGWFQGKRAFLLDGEIFEISGQGNWHALAIELIDEKLRAVMPQPCRFRIQMPLEGPNEASDPEPDIAVIAGRIAPNITTHPSTAMLVVEVADTSLRLDRRKAAAYAAMQIPEYWIANLVNRQLEVHRDPQPDSSADYGWRYRQIATLSCDEFVSCGQTRVAVADLFPARPPGETF